MLHERCCTMLLALVCATTAVGESPPATHFWRNDSANLALTGACASLCPRLSLSLLSLCLYSRRRCRPDSDHPNGVQRRGTATTTALPFRGMSRASTSATRLRFGSRGPWAPTRLSHRRMATAAFSSSVGLSSQEASGATPSARRTLRNRHRRASRTRKHTSMIWSPSSGASCHRRPTACSAQREPVGRMPCT